MEPPEEQQKQPPASGSVAAALEEEGRRIEAGEEYRYRAELARKLLKPRRRAQIEVWTREVADRWDLQHCVSGRRYGHLMAAPVDDDEDVCTICGRVPEDVDKKPGVSRPERTATDQQVNGDSKSGKEKKHMFRGIRMVVGQLTSRDGVRSGEKKHQEERWDPALSTQMFLAGASEYASSATASWTSGRSCGGNPNKLKERMARLTRAQRLLDKSQARQC